MFLLYFSFNSVKYCYIGKWASNKANCSDPQKLFESITFNQNDVVEFTFYLNRNGTHEFLENSRHWNPIGIVHLGQCFTLNIPADSHFIAIKLLVNSTIFYHTPGMFKKVIEKDIRQQKKSSLVRSSIVLGNRYNFNLKYEYWDFGRKLHDYDGVPCINEKGYSKDLCTSGEIEQDLLENFGCTTPFGPNKTKICNNATIGEKAFKIYEDAIYGANYKSCFNP